MGYYCPGGEGIFKKQRVHIVFVIYSCQGQAKQGSSVITLDLHDSARTLTKPARGV
jgi:hypothetical protein